VALHLLECVSHRSLPLPTTLPAPLLRFLATAPDNPLEIDSQLALFSAVGPAAAEDISPPLPAGGGMGFTLPDNMLRLLSVGAQGNCFLCADVVDRACRDEVCSIRLGNCPAVSSINK